MEDEFRLHVIGWFMMDWGIWNMGGIRYHWQAGNGNGVNSNGRQHSIQQHHENRGTKGFALWGSVGNTAMRFFRNGI